MDRDPPYGGDSRTPSDREGRTTIERYMHQLDAAGSSQRAVLKSVETNAPVANPNVDGAPEGPGFASAPREIVPLNHVGAWRHGARAGVPGQADGLLPKASLNPLAQAAEQFDALRVNLWTRRAHGEAKTTLFLSPQTDAGATTTATNYAALLSRDPRARILLIDANMRNRDAQDRSGAGWQETPDLAALLLDGATLAPREATSGLYFLPSGIFRATPLSLLQSETFDRFLDGARAVFDHIVIDGPPLHGAPEALVLARKCDETVLVIDAGSTRRQSALWAKQQIESAGGRLVGVVLNKRRFYIPGWLYRWI